MPIAAFDQMDRARELYPDAKASQRMAIGRFVEAKLWDVTSGREIRRFGPIRVFMTAGTLVPLSGYFQVLNGATRRATED